MCGIAGWFNFSAKKLTEEPGIVLKRMGQRIAHRGPDGEGTWHTTHAGFAHRRLAIIDINGGHQPMLSGCGQICITYNGEIYNYKELRETYSNYAYSTSSDTETILALYTQLGEQAFSLLRGMFAFALWDTQKKRGYLVRDPQGIKPLFFTHQNQQLIFASEAKAIFAHPDSTPSLNTTNLHHCLNFRYIPGNGSMFSGVSQIPPGYMRISDNHISHHPILLNSDSHHSLAEILDDSINAHLVADVPVGLYLSGGLDSGLIANTMRISKPDTHTFTMATGDDPNEANNALRSASIFKLANTQLSIGSVSQELLTKLIWHLEVPKINALQVFLLAEQTAKHSKVVLSGLGGDELFFGYNAHALFYSCYQLRYLQKFSINKLIANSAESLINTRSFWSEKQRMIKMLSALGNWPRVYGLLRNVWDTPNNRQMLYGERMLDEAPDSSFDLLEELWPQNADPLIAMSEFELNQKMVNDLLLQEDRTSMAHGLEVRTPFVDKEFFHYVRSIPRSKRIPFGKKKHILRQLGADRLPNEILNRKKSGFQVNAPVFFNQELASIHKHYLSEENIKRYGIFNHRTIAQFKRLPQTKNHRWHYMFLYLATMTHIWLEIHESNLWSDSSL